MYINVNNNIINNINIKTVIKNIDIKNRNKENNYKE